MSPQTDAVSDLARLDHSRWFADEVQPHEPALRAYLRGRFPALTDVDDLIQETYSRVLRAKTTRRIAEVRPYLFAMARNAALDLARRARVVAIESLPDIEQLPVAEERPDAAALLDRDEEIALLREAIAALPERCREVLCLRRFDELSHREISERLGLSLKTVDAHLCVAVFRCRRFLLARGVSRDRLQNFRSQRSRVA